MGNTKKSKRIIYLSITLLFITAATLVLRGPHVSNALKKLILPELENISGQKVVAQKIQVNLFPLFVQAKNIKIFDQDGERLLSAERVKCYMKLSSLLNRELFCQRIVVVKPEIWADKKKVDGIVQHIDDYLKKQSDKKLIRNGEFVFHNLPQHAMFSGRGLNATVLLGDVPKLKIDIDDLAAYFKSLPPFKCGIKTILFLKKDGIDIKSLTVRSYGSEINASGFFTPEKSGFLHANAELLVETVKKTFGLKQRGEGKILTKGYVKFENGKPMLNLKLKGNFYLQSLMELIDVKEKLEGMIDFDGWLVGSLSDIKARASAKLTKGNLYSVDIEKLECDVLYENNMLSFTNGKGTIYNGYAEAEASLKMPNISYYTLKIKFKNVDGPSLFKLAELDFGLSAGNTKGELYTAGAEFDPSGWFDYESTATGTDFSGRIKKIKGEYEVSGDLLELSAIDIRTNKSAIALDGSIILSKGLLDLKGKVLTYDITDFTLPYFGKLKGTADFTGVVKGSFDDPVISGALNVLSPAIEDYKFDKAFAELSYKKNSLDITELSITAKDERHSARGSIKFHNAKKIFDFNQPEYNLTASIKNADMEKIAELIYKNPPLKGRLNSEIKITGNASEPVLAGVASANNIMIYNCPADSAFVNFNYNFKDLTLNSATIKRNGSLITLKALLSEKKNSSFSLSAKNLYLKDICLPNMPSDAVLNLEASGSGTFENPLINLNANLSGGTYKGRPLGNGVITGSVKDKNISLHANLFNEKIKINSTGHLDKNLPWSARIEFLSGKYDFLFAGLLKDVPEDLLVNLTGHVNLSGDMKHINADALIKQFNITLFGNSFSNSSDIKIKVENKNVSFSGLTLNSGSSSFSLTGNIAMQEKYNLVLDGSSNLAPLKSLSKRINLLKGDADFTLSITGKWNSPQINGSLSISDASFGLKDFHQRITPINGYVYFENNQIYIQRLAGKFGGGDIQISGLINLEAFKVKNFKIDSQMDNITALLSKDFNVNFSGDVTYKGTLDSQAITGEMKVNRAKYRERVEWKSWLLKVKSADKPKTEPNRFEKAALNIKLRDSDNIFVDNNIARAQLRADLVLRGTVANPILFGRVETKSGKIFFRNNEFQIISASADFADPNRINPLMEIVAQTTVKGYNIKLSLEGQIEQFTMSLVSDPPLNETDILALLTVGQVGKELKGLEGSITASEATAFITGKAQDVFEERMKTLTGLDRVQVDPYVSKTTGTIGPRITVSKKLIGDKLFVTYSSSVGSTEEQLINLEYNLGKNVSLVGVRDEKGSLGSDIKFRFEFK
jgi:autotransporter translocation and assembly factor TamB